MAIDILITTDRLSRDPIGRELLAHVRAQASALDLENAALYYDFPTYSDYETVAHKPDALIISPIHGVIALRFLDLQAESPSPSAMSRYDESLIQFCSILIGRMVKSKLLRRGMGQAKVPVTPVIFSPSTTPGFFVPDTDSQVITSLQGIDNLIVGLADAPLSSDAFSELRSVVEGAKALTRPKPRTVDDPASQPLADAVAKLESEIANFDQRQRRVALISVNGPQRIRGLAGSGKTVILAMKAAHLHLTRPNDRILITFYTRSLRATIKNLVTRFYRHYRDEDPNWDQIDIRHGWGGSRSSGAYADACRRQSIHPMNFGEAQSAAALEYVQKKKIGRIDPFDFACRNLISSVAVQPYYDHVLIDEGQDFPAGFYELCFFLAKGERDKKNIIWAYDELQNILDVTIRSPEFLFGQDYDGQARISLERSSSSLPSGGTNDHVLSKCYRNQREVLLSAHALGFGIYSDSIVQLLESREHWEDVGYEVITDGPFTIGKPIRILRPSDNSPVSIAATSGVETIDTHVADTAENEIIWAAAEVRKFLNGGLRPEDILVICLDDRSSRSAFKSLSEKLALDGIHSNNIIADPYNEPAFTLDGHVTLSTVYRAKGNEAIVVIAMGVNAVSLKLRSGRNKLFTAFTRTKAWLRVSGVGSAAMPVMHELQTAIGHYPNLDFIMPDLAAVETIQRDLSLRSIKAKAIREEYLKRLQAEGIGQNEASELLAFGGGYDEE
ncbi:hypothetical protein DBR33_03755 [Stenotrophomonas sp. HMWF022]|nr:hypothetical protein DBR33_03755 [Stenotrophomonas sp. HMWF022]